MHINVHFGIGLIIASVTHYFIQLNIFTFSFIVLCGFILDFDIIFKKYAKDHNHRMLISHSIYPSLIIIIIGIILNEIWVLMGGIAYFCHILIDLIDWGTNFFYNNKIFGLRLLLTPEERIDLSHVLEDKNNRQFFFVQRYYSSKLMIILEILIGISMFIAVFVFVINYWYFIFGYVFFFGFHLSEYIGLKNRKMGKKSRIPLINH
ncbi:hypothetical protein DSAG12_01687 [Promethearchaeum syntrophicum]|uniref:Inner membrane protein n=1 Tax=Promethearchaeum syntrophicum TaxID=2594042 RepID=A0A5B9DAQ9_9ARCH|nr:hypothetical protein [Candidatus Prometheoarchaeum syntrophicum]QEE15860.1 hypothetical protein DSAG12_01687 [Candidatus Prometheoarchaeum syntrophicum]